MTKTAEQILATYIKVRYQNWLDYSVYYCKINSIDGEARDVLNEVLEKIWEKDHLFLNNLLNQKKKNGTGLDFYVLRMLRIFIKMPKAPYRWKYHTRKVKCSPLRHEKSVLQIQDETNIYNSELCLRSIQKHKKNEEIASRIIYCLFKKKKKRRRIKKRVKRV